MLCRRLKHGDGPGLTTAQGTLAVPPFHVGPLYQDWAVDRFRKFTLPLATVPLRGDLETITPCSRGINLTRFSYVKVHAHHTKLSISA